MTSTRLPEPLVLRHGRVPNLAAAAVCTLLVGLFLLRWRVGAAGGAVLLAPALLLFGGFALHALLRALDRRPVAVLDANGLMLPDQLVRPLPWSEVVEVQERRLGRSRLLVYVRDLDPWRRRDRPAQWSVDALVGKVLPGFERPRLILETRWLDRGHAAVRETLRAFWGAALR